MWRPVGESGSTWRELCFDDEGKETPLGANFRGGIRLWIIA
jgi:hypothetical protein